MEENRNDSTKPVNEGEQVVDNNEQQLHSDPFYTNPYATQPAFGQPVPVQPENIKQSGLGIASFIIALVAVLLGIIGIILSVAFTAGIADDPQSIVREIENNDISSVASIMVAGLMLIAGAGIAFIGLILGIVGAFAKDRRKAFAIVGIILNGLIVVGIVALTVLGLAIGANSV
ncbi:hypothetical protein [Paenibacillus radicis (ex Gao et al. 2016)]|uniref:DUF4064 domain-containing protein n=1 Tax=Paenibacillus radicis (ex Gao et al. 2016) TaxID=1737354 RepID=A0A917HCQ7_9BACL|nr:hypothetical protein [Paenibacillus radicis (ex Gao et al. 2016)]GGG75049.1 hypothetical protein GCM10010918_34060 [Paenibacillus radicis (ex Gao et al. 2016)]